MYNIINLDGILISIINMPISIWEMFSFPEALVVRNPILISI